MKRLLLCLLAFSCALSVCSKVVKIEADEPFEFKGPDGNKYKYILVGDGNGGLCAAVVQRSVFKDRYGNLRHEEERWTHHQAKPYGYESIVIPDTVKYKGSDFVVRVICPFAFRYEENLKNITLPKTINAIHDCPFYSRGVLNIHISDMTTWLNLKDTYPMPDHRLYVNGKLVTHLVIPEGMTGKAIGWQFSCNVALESVILPNSMKDQTPIFDGCKNLREVVFPERLKNIWVYSFRYCKSLKRIVIPASVEKIGKEAFNGEDHLFTMEYIGKTESGSSERHYSKAKDPARLLKKVCIQAIDQNIAKLQHEYPDFRIKAPLFSTEPLRAYVGQKEDITPQSRFEVLERVIDDEGRLSYKRVGIIKPLPGRPIWDNRYMADDDDADVKLGFTESEKVRGSEFYPGMLIREIDE